MHFNPTAAAIITSALLLGGGVNAVALPSKSINKRAERGDRCFVSGEKACSGAGDTELTCLGPPGADLFFAGTLPCVPGFQVCIDGGCVVDPNRLKPDPGSSSVAEPEPSSTATEAAVPEATDGSDSGCGGFLGGI